MLQRSLPVVGVLGCMAERLKERLFDSRSVDIVAGPDALRSVPRLIDLFMQVLRMSDDFVTVALRAQHRAKQPAIHWCLGAEASRGRGAH